ncbi:stress response protein nst1-like isoform X1 [Seriola dumerili]|uniref:Platelet-derived growth factor subunit B n=2 Tax=Seriola dumerili TaxID=41447 RepID=A0A3B4V3Y7_SERDU|nr:stress response protein nst1-like isoform X1 [Seriola dumerili]XP_022612764.1 stress response protein nst1-like isoform X1 [Seriola dumerili]
MSSWVQLLLVLLAACLRFGVAEGDPLPAALVELVRNSPIASIEDLQLLLLSDSVDEEDGTSAANGGHRLPRSLDAQPAQQALCKVRTEVVEITRAMLDRSNANFLLWPPCVEVQRCSGCCNTKSLQCVPVVTHTRYLQVMKIEYVNKRPTYAKAVVSVVDHVECRCQPAPRPPAPRRKSSRRQHSHQHQNQTLGQEHGQGQVKMHSKDELHQWDELKQNQRAHLEDLLEQHWSPRGDTFTQPGEGYSLAGEDTSRSGEAVHFAPHWAHNSSGLHATGEQSENVERKDGRISDGNKTVSSEGDVGVEPKNKMVEGGNGLLLNVTEGKVNEGNGGRDKAAQTRSPLLQEDKSKFTKSHTSGISPPVTQNPQAKFSPTEETISQRVGSRARPTKEPNPDPRQQARRRENETPEEERILQIEEAKLEEERRELLLLHKRLDQEKEILRQQQVKREEEERQREKEADGRHHLHGKHHRLQTTTQKPESTTSTTTTRQPSAPAGPRPPARPNQTKRRMRKNRKRISKAAMRAMLM